MVLVPAIANGQSGALGEGKIPPDYRIAPPDDTDLVDLATGDLDTPCRHSGTTGANAYPPDPQLQFQIAVGRYVGPTNPDGTLVHAAQMVQDGTLGAYAELTFMFFENTVGGCDPPPHRIMYNGQWVADENPGEPGTLQNAGRGWAQRTFRVPIERVRFPAAPGAEPGVAPIPAVNDIHIEWAVPNSCLSCFVVDWVSQRVRVVSPVILIHGNSQGSGWWTHHGFTWTLDDRKILWRAVDFQPSATSVEANVLALEYAPGFNGVPAESPDNRVAAKARQLGAERVHIVCHSKGGLDARRWLAIFGRGSSVRTVSLTTLSTPHNGSTLADLTVAAREAAIDGATRLYYGIPVPAIVMDALLTFAGANDGHPALTTHQATSVNSMELLVLPRSVQYGVVGADMDLTDDQTVNVPAELTGLADDVHYEWGGEIVWLGAHLDIAFETSVNRIYQILRSVQSVSLRIQRNRVSRHQLSDLPRYSAVASFLGSPNPPDVRRGNDSLVTISSALGHGSFEQVVQPDRSVVFEGPWDPTGVNLIHGRNHSNIGGPIPAQFIVPWLLSADAR